MASVFLGLLSVGIVWNETMVAVDALTHYNLSWINIMTEVGSEAGDKGDAGLDKGARGMLCQGEWHSGHGTG